MLNSRYGKFFRYSYVFLFWFILDFLMLSYDVMSHLYFLHLWLNKRQL